MRRAASVCPILVLILISTSIALGQGSKPEASKVEHDNDDPAGRLLWFMEGRQTPDGSLPAVKLNEAMRQKFELRTTRELQMRQMMQTLGPGLAPAGTTVGDGSTVWTPLGPAPILPNATEGVNWNAISGRVSAVAVDPSDSTGNTIYVGGATGGVWKSTNAAAADPTAVIWTPIIDQQQTLAVGAIAVSPDGGTVLVGTGEAKTAIDSYYGQGILRSTDRGATWTLITGDSSGHSLLGVGVAKIAFNTANPNVVVAATTSTGVGNATGAFTTGVSTSGLWRSGDGGATWTAIQSGVTDGGTPIFLSAAHSVVYNAAAGKFFAQYRFHGIYQSADGLIWTRLDKQPDPILTTTACPANPISSDCPMYRAEMAVVPGKNEMYVWYVDWNGTAAANDHGVWLSTDGGANWSGLDKAGIDACATGGSSTEGGCSVSQGYFYNLTIGAMANPTDSNLTDVYVGAVNLFKCTLDPRSTGTASRCQIANPEPKRFMNITHVYGLGSCGFGGFAKIHPDQHAIAIPANLSSIIYFGNDGGVYRTTNPAGLNTGTCGSQPAGGMPFDSLNTNIGSMTQFVWATPHPTDKTGFIGGAQDNASTMTSSSITGTTTSTNGKSFVPYAGGDGGYDAIRTDTGQTILYSTFTNVDIWTCSNGFNCTSVDNVVVRNSDLTQTGWGGSDNSAFYAPWLLDPYDPSKLILGSCRVWRGISTPGPTQLYEGVILSQKLGNNVPGSLFCAKGSTTATSDPNVSALAAGGPKSATAGTAKVIYAAIYPSTSVWMTTNADSLSTWSNVSPSVLNPNGWKISSLTIDQAGDPTGMTVYATIQGFGGAHVIKSTNGGTSWASITGNLPDSPANTLAIDPDDHTVVYVGTDVGVFVTTNNGTSWVEVGPTLPGPVGASGFLPNTPVSHLAFSTAGGLKRLMAATYGRGIWLTDLTTTSPQASFDQTSLDFGSLPVNTISASQALNLTNSGSADMTISSIAIGGTNPTSFAISSDTCPRSPSTLTVGSSCTINVTATPKAAGPLNGTVAVSDNAPGSPQSVPLTVTGTLLFTVSPNSVTFPAQLVGTSSAATAISITNDTPAAQSITTLDITGTNAADFIKDAGCVGANLAASTGSCTMNVTFTPTATGNRVAVLTIHSTGNADSVVNLSGTGAVPTIGIAPSSVSFGAQKVGQTSAAQNVTLTNTGGVDLHISAIATTSPYAAILNTCGPLPKSLAPNASCVVQVTFTPASVGAAPATNLIITDDTNALPGTTHAVALTGTGGLGNGTLSGGPLTFSGTPITSNSTTKDLTLTNSGRVATTISGITFTGTNAAEFAQTNTCNGSVAAGANCTITVTFKPTATGNRAATISVADDGTASPSTTTVSGTGEDFTQSTGTSTSTVSAGGIATFTMTETPAGGSFTNPITFTCSGLDATMGCSFNPAQVTPGASATTTSVTITTRKGGSTTPVLQGSARQHRGGSPLLAFWLGLPGMVVLFPTIGNRKFGWKKKLGLTMLLLILLSMVLSMAGCGGGNSSTTSFTAGTSVGAHSINIVATSGSLSRTTPVTVTVQ